MVTKMRKKLLKIALDDGEQNAILDACPERQVAPWARSILLHAAGVGPRNKSASRQKPIGQNHDLARVLGRTYEALQSLNLNRDTYTNDEFNKLFKAACDDIHQLTIIVSRLENDN
jgi:hypothetical protein